MMGRGMPGMRLLAWALLAGMLALAGCSSTPPMRGEPPRSEGYSPYGNPETYEVLGQRYAVMQDNRGYREVGLASWYGPGFHGKRASSGETYDMYAMTAAHKTLRIPTYVQVTNLENGRRVVVRVNDRGPFHDDRIIDLSYAAAQRLGMLGKGTARVEVRHLDGDQPAPQDDAPIQLAGPAAVSGRPIFLQVGAFAEAANAERLRQRLLEARIGQVAVAVRPDGLHRVRIGPLGSLQQADDLARRLDALGLGNRSIVHE